MEIHGFTQTGTISVTIDGRHATVPNDMSNTDRQLIAEWEAQGNTIPPYVPPVIDISAMDQAALNQALAQEGSVVRALALVMLQEINTLRVRAGLAAYTQAQLVSALKAKMR